MLRTPFSPPRALDKRPPALYSLRHTAEVEILSKYEELCIVGNAKAPQNNPITYRFSQFFITFIVKAETGEILDVEATMLLRVTNDFVRRIFLGRTLTEVEAEVTERVKRTYLASSQKAIQVAYADAVKKYQTWKRAATTTE